MSDAHHRIRSQRWVVHTSSAENAFAWRKFLRSHGEEVLLPVFERAFDEATDGDRVLRIPKIELKIEIGPEDSLTEKLRGTVLDQLRDHLPKSLREEPRSPEKSSGWREFTVRESRFTALLHYLRTGAVAWHAMSASGSETVTALAETSRDERGRLLDHLRTHDEAAPFYFRLLEIQPLEKSLSWVDALSDRIPEQIRQDVVQWITLLLTAGQRYLHRHARLHLASVLLSESLSRRGGSLLQEAFSAAAEALPPGERPAYDQFVSSLPAPAPFPWRREDPGIRRGDESPSPLFQTNGAMQEPLPSVEADSRNVAGLSSPGAFAVEPGRGLSAPASGSPAETGPAADLFPLAVHQAGLVLLHPFITRFFEYTGVKEKGAPRLLPFALPRAAALLFFAASGREEVHEYEIGLVKVLLGLRPETPLPVCEGLLRPEDRDQAEALLQSVIGHWGALKNTSLQGLRSSFLDRRALLREEEKGWRLQVERKPFDMLLDHLPWSITVIKLPWMKRPMYTEW